MREAAQALRLTAQDLNELGVADKVIGEPLGGAHRDKARAIADVGNAIKEMLAEMGNQGPKQLISDRRRKYLDLGSKGLAA